MPAQGDWAEVARLRQGLYRLLGSAFLPPEEDRMTQLADAARYLDEMGVEQFAFAPFWRRFLEAFDQLPQQAELSAEHVRLFWSSAEATLCPPVESYYVASAEGGSLAALLSELDREYRAMGIRVEAGRVEAADHIAVQMEVMADLCRQEAEAAEAKNAPALEKVLDTQHRFLVRHLGRWLPAFRARVGQAIPFQLYQRLVELAEVYVAHDASFVPSLNGLLSGQS